MQTYLIQILILFILFFLGLGLTSIFLPKTDKDERFWLSPWFGTILIIVLGMALNLSKIPMGEPVYDVEIFRGSNIILAFSIFLFFYALLTKNIRSISLHANLALFALVVGGLLFFNMPIKFLSVIQDGNFVAKETIIEKVIAEKQISYTSYKLGVPLVISFFADVLKMDIALVSRLSVGIYLSLLFSSIAIFLKKHVGASVVFISFLILLRVTQKFYTVSLYEIFFIGVLLIFIALFLQYFSQTKEKNLSLQLSGYDLLLGAGLSSLASIDPTGFKLFFGGFLILIPIISLYHKRWQLLAIPLKIILIALFLNPIVFGFALRN